MLKHKATCNEEYFSCQQLHNLQSTMDFILRFEKSSINLSLFRTGIWYYSCGCMTVRSEFTCRLIGVYASFHLVVKQFWGAQTLFFSLKYLVPLKTDFFLVQPKTTKTLRKDFLRDGIILIWDIELIVIQYYRFYLGCFITNSLKPLRPSLVS